MRATSIIFRRELGSYLRSPVGWIIAVVLAEPIGPISTRTNASQRWKLVMVFGGL